MTATPPPALSAILITPDTFGRLRQTIAALHAQTIRDRIELVFVAPEQHSHEIDEEALAGFHSHQAVFLDKVEFTSAEAWAAGIRSALAPIVVLCEDHSYPEPDWAEHLLAAHQQPWAVVGPAVRNANPGGLVNWADYFVAYSEWAYPTESGSREHLPGHNSSYKRDLLLAYGADLARKLQAETLLHWDLLRQGHQLFLQADAVTNHVNFTRLRVIMRMQWWCGRNFAALRTSSWPWRRRLPWVFASLLIPAVRLRRIYREIRKPGRFDGSLPVLLALICFILLCDGLGQMIGCALGSGNIYPLLSDYELNGEQRFNERTS